MTFNEFISNFEKDDNEVDIVINYSILINHLENMKNNITFSAIGDKYIDILNNIVLDDIKANMTKKIEYMTDLIEFHINRKKKNNDSIIIDKSKTKTEDKKKKVQFNFNSIK